MKQHRHVKMLWVGDGWWRDRLLKRVADLGLADQVITTGLVPPEQIPKYHQAMDVVAHMSYREGLPRVVTQALLSALPVIAYDVDGTREVCLDGDTGRLLKPGDRSALAEAARWMIEHPEERAAMGQRGRELCRQRFAARTMVEQLERIYEDVLGR
jgi:glycosyltransferase involved in cell wall biosynthesis